MYHQYADFEIPSGIGNFYLGGSPNNPGPFNSTYCGNQGYAWGTDFTPDELKFSGGWTFNYSGECTQLSPAEHIRIGDTSFSVVTQETLTYQNGSVQFRLVNNAESVIFNMIHILSASFIPSGVVNAPCIIRNKDGRELASFASGSIISGLSIQDWLTFADASLDGKNVQPWIRGGAPEYQPHFRVTGIVLLMRVQYTNLRFGEWPSASIGSPRADITIEALQNAWGNLGYVQVLCV